jgi:hypothetical protein
MTLQEIEEMTAMREGKRKVFVIFLHLSQSEMIADAWGDGDQRLARVGNVDEAFCGSLRGENLKVSCLISAFKDSELF